MQEPPAAVRGGTASQSAMGTVFAPPPPPPDSQETLVTSTAKDADSGTTHGVQSKHVRFATPMTAETSAAARPQPLRPLPVGSMGESASSQRNKLSPHERAVQGVARKSFPYIQKLVEEFRYYDSRAATVGCSCDTRRKFWCSRRA